jgi:hypothetical protein
LATSISSKEFCSVCGIDAPHHAALSKRGKKWLQGRFHQENQTFLQVRFDSVLRVWYPLLVLEGQAVHPQIRWILRWQLIVAMVAGFMTAIFFGVDAAVSAVLGGGIAMASGFAYAWRAFRPSGPASADAKKACPGVQSLCAARRLAALPDLCCNGGCVLDGAAETALIMV